MTKGELIEKLIKNKLPNHVKVLVSVKKYHGGEATWDEVKSVDETHQGAPVLIYLGETVMS